MDLPEIADLLVSYDPVTLERQPIHKEDVAQAFRQRGQTWAARIVGGFPEKNGMLDAAALDFLLIQVNTEWQRFSEEFQIGRRLAQVLRPLLRVLREAGVPRPLRIVDIGSGIGFAIRWLAAKGHLGDDVELVGADFNPVLVDEARRLAAAEKLPCQFVVANAFDLAPSASLYLSTFFLHHFHDHNLEEFFHQQDRPGTSGFVHLDFQPSPLAKPGAWLFHAVRFRQPMARHDGVLSAVRAHPGDVLLKAAKAGAPGMAPALYGRRLRGLPFPRTFQTVIGLRREFCSRFQEALGRRASRLEAWQ
jgi:SAM-dependent methyltransferase